ncbi:hypothetical protein LJR034_008525 [Caballeronia sp. LjRoot34]
MYQPASRNGMLSPDIKIGLAEKCKAGEDRTAGGIPQRMGQDDDA